MRAVGQLSSAHCRSQRTERPENGAWNTIDPGRGAALQRRERRTDCKFQFNLRTLERRRSNGIPFFFSADVCTGISIMIGGWWSHARVCASSRWKVDDAKNMHEISIATPSKSVRHSKVCRTSARELCWPASARGIIQYVAMMDPLAAERACACLRIGPRTQSARARARSRA